VLSNKAKYRHISFARSWKLGEQTVFEMGQCNAFVDSLSAVPIDPVDRKRLLNVSLIKGAMATTAIEGNTLSEEEVSLIAEGEELAPSKKYQEGEVKNILESFNTLLKEVAVDNKIQKITPSMLKRFHKMVGKDLGEVFQAIPGRFRNSSVHVGGIYVPPQHEDIPALVDQFCEWSLKEFHFERGQTFKESIIHAVVSHVYIAWIHPFGDGNGRTARLIEFYIMLRAGNPDFASHLLSNFYNETRSEYYYHLDKSRKTGDISEFIEYAVRGYRDGLMKLLTIVSDSLFKSAWQNYVHEIFHHKKTTGNLGVVLKRCRDLILAFPLKKTLTMNEITLLNVDIAATYKVLSQKTLDRDISQLMEMGLLTLKKDGYSAHSDILSRYIPIKAPNRS